jgi:hypothetical protein
MKKATVTYTAPKGDSKVVEMLGTTFYDGQAVPLVCDEGAMTRLQSNRHFKVGAVSDYDPEKDGVPVKPGGDDDDDKRKPHGDDDKRKLHIK